MAEPAEDRGDDLAPDASLATDIPDEEERRAEQMKYYGGDADEIDTEDFDSVDRGDSLEVPEVEELEAAEEEPEQEDDEDDDTIAEETDDTISEDEDVDEDDEDSVEDSEPDDDDDVEPEAPKTTDQRIPLSRFNEVNERMKQAEARLAQLEAQESAVEQVQEEAYDFDAAEMAYQDLLLDGKTSEATAKRNEIRAAERELWKQEAKTETVQEVSQQEAIRELDSLSKQAAQMYPVFDDTSADYDDRLTQQVLTFMRGYSELQPPGDAFVSALADVIQLHDLDSRYGHNQPAEEPAPKKVTKKKTTKTKEKLAIAEKQVRSPAGAGRGSNDAGAAVPDIEKMSDAEIDALPAETLARLRGDFVD